MTDLIDTTEMYLRTILELEEEGITPMRARIAERLEHSGPTVSQTVARMEKHGLLSVEPDRHLALTDAGRKKAVEVMRKHRLAERLLSDVIGLDIEYVHDEACRWEHVMSDHVEKRILAMLNNPKFSPYGNAIPGLEELGVESEHNDDIELLKLLADAGISFGASVSVIAGKDDDVIVRADGEETSLSLDEDVANAIVVKRS